MQSTCQSNKNTSPPRSLVALTGEKNVFAHLHSHFCWLLWGGSRYLTDCPTIGSAVAPPWLGKDTAEGFTLIQVDKEEWLIRKKFGENAAFGPDLLQSITALKLFFDSNRTGFISAAYCCLTGVQIVFRGPATVVQILAKGFARLVPEHFDRLFSAATTNYDADKRIVCVSSTTTVPPANLKICHVDVASNEQIIVKWPGDVGNKLPQLLQHLVKAFAEPRFTIEILEKQLKVLVMEWKKWVQDSLWERTNCMIRAHNIFVAVNSFAFNRPRIATTWTKWRRCWASRHRIRHCWTIGCRICEVLWNL